VVLDTDASPVTVDSHLWGTILLKRNVAGNFTVNMRSDVPLYGTFTLAIWNDGTGGSFTVTIGSNASAPGTHAVANNTIRVIRFIGLIGESGQPKWYQDGTPVDTAD
jgi:hypothetical protein